MSTFQNPPVLYNEAQGQATYTRSYTSPPMNKDQTQSFGWEPINTASPKTPRNQVTWSAIQPKHNGIPVVESDPWRSPRLSEDSFRSSSLREDGRSNLHYGYSPSPYTRTTYDTSSTSPSKSSQSQSNDLATDKKRKRLHKKNFVRSTGGDQLSFSNSSGAANARSTSGDVERDPSQLVDDFSNLPASLKLAAAKRLGIIDYRKAKNDQPLVPLVSHTRPHSRQKSSETTYPGSRPGSSGQRSYVRIIPSSIRPPPIDLTPHKPPPIDTNLVGNSFYLSSSDSETEEEDQQSSSHSHTSSHTSYNVSSSVNGDLNNSPKPQRDLADEQSQSSFSPRTSGVSHQSQSSASSFGSQKLVRPFPPASKPISSSKPVSRPIILNHNASTPLNVIPDGWANDPPQLSSIKEDSPNQSNQATPNTQTTNSTIAQHTTSSQRRRVPPSLMLMRDRVSSSVKSTQDVGVAAQRVPESVHVSNLAMNVRSRSGHHRSEEHKSEPIKHGAVMHRNRQPMDVPKIQEGSRSNNDTVRHLRSTSMNTFDRRSARPLSLAITRQSEAFVSSDCAEVIILQIFEKLGSFRDLFACARLNQGFYKVFKRHELHLMKNALRNMSPAEWELREASPTEIISHNRGGSEYTPRTYLQFHQRDAFTLNSLKALMLTRCRAYLRPETMKALVTKDSDRSQRIDDAIWRIWTFCTIFGADKGFENDLEAQTDWLSGGVKAHRPKSYDNGPENKATTESFLLKHAPESFGRGNYGGLTVDELFDILETWKCIKELMRGILGPNRCAQARKYGIFDSKYGSEKDPRSEETLLEEWIYYLTSLGLSTVVDLAQQTNSKQDEVFSTAEHMEWTNWTLPGTNVTRGNFLEEIVSQLHREKAMKAQKPSWEEIHAKRKSWGWELAAELREQKTKSIMSLDPLSQHSEESINLWLEWMARAEGVKPSTQNAGTSERAGAKTTVRVENFAPRTSDKEKEDSTHSKPVNVAIDVPQQNSVYTGMQNLPRAPAETMAVRQSSTTSKIADTTGEPQTKQLAEMGHSLQSVGATPGMSRPNPPDQQAKSTGRKSRANSALSIFPPEYAKPTPNSTPRVSQISTPKRNTPLASNKTTPTQSRNASRASSVTRKPVPVAQEPSPLACPTQVEQDP